MPNEDYDFEGASEGGAPRCTEGTYRFAVESLTMGPSTRKDLENRILYTANVKVLEVISGGQPVVINPGEIEENPPPGPVLVGQSRALRFKIDGTKGERDRARVLRMVQCMLGFKSDYEAKMAKDDDGKPVNWNQEIKDAAKADNPLEGREFIGSLVRGISTKTKRAYYAPSFAPVE